MLRQLGVFTLLKWFILACIAVAIWRAYHGDLGQIANGVWHWVNKGADVVTNIWHQMNKK